MLRFLNKILTFFIGIIIGFLTYLLALSGCLLNIVSGLFFFLGVLALFLGEGFAVSFLMFFTGYLISPLGLPMLADYLLAKLVDFNNWLKDFNY